ncbi:solute carrier family 35 member C2 isoform X3 [Pungitius pungitius]|uniref:solute carrier family 35 member C2 isoform X3 n=1 Tax=Pungitius pungitius TaxID=134920 RepID=UPI002E1488E9
MMSNTRTYCKSLWMKASAKRNVTCASPYENDTYRQNKTDTRQALRYGGRAGLQTLCGSGVLRWELCMACPVHFFCRGLRTVGLVLFYYVFSIGITFYNKWLMKGFRYPLFMTLVHLAINFCLSALTRRAMTCWTGKPRTILSWKDYLRKVAPTALATALDIGLSNWSFLFITISLYTMTKSSAVLFILFFSLVFKLEEPNPFLILVVLLISCGLFMFTFESTQFNLKGFTMVLVASFIGGIRWTLTQVLMQKAELGLQHPIDALYHLQPLMFAGLFPLFLYNEGLSLSTSDKLFRVTELSPVLYSLSTLSVGGLLAFGLGFSEFLLVSRTSSLTLSISGIFKLKDHL